MAKVSSYFNKNSSMSDASPYMSSLVKILDKTNYILGASGQKNIQKQPSLTVFCWYENLWIFKTWELQIWYQQNLSGMCTTYV